MPATPPYTPKSVLTDGQRAYEARRAQKAGVSLERWLADKQKQINAAAREQERVKKTEAKAAKPPGFLSRLLEKAHKPL